MSDAEFEVIHVQANGLRFEVHTAGDPASDRLALLLHGFPECWYSWRYQMPLLARLGYRVWAPDLRGYGGTDKPARVEDYALDRLVEDVAGLIDASGASRVTLIAHDWGGAIAWEFVMRKLRPVERFVALNMPHPHVFRRHLFRLGPQLLRSWYILLFQLPRVPEWWLSRSDHRAIAAAFRGMAVDKSRFPREVLDVYRAYAARPGVVPAMLAYYRAGLRHPPARPTPSQVEVPTLIVWGEEDTALGRELAAESPRFVRDCTLRWVPRCSHWVQQEAPETVNAVIEAWLTDAEPLASHAGP